MEEACGNLRLRVTPVVRLSRDLERQIDDKAEKAVVLRAEADQLENDTAERATALVTLYLSGKPI